MLTREERFWLKVGKPTPEGCRPWTSFIDPAGYGRTKNLLGTPYVHRIAYMLANGPIPDGHEIDHTCHNQAICYAGPECQHRRCCEPAHLQAVPVEANRVARQYRDASNLYCPQGHPKYGPELYINKRTGQRGCRECTRNANRTPRSKAEVQPTPDPTPPLNTLVQHAVEPDSFVTESNHFV